MHTTFFSMKRAFHGVLRISRQALAQFGLTPARFDMLYALYRHRPWPSWQSALRGVLGVTAPTVSRMLGSLEKLGLVKRERDCIDTRQRLVELTEAGLRRVQKVHDELVASGAAQLALDCALAYPAQHDRRVTHTAARIFERFLDRIRLQFRDFASLSYREYPMWLILGTEEARWLRIPIRYKVF